MLKSPISSRDEVTRHIALDWIVITGVLYYVHILSFGGKQQFYAHPLSEVGV